MKLIVTALACLFISSGCSLSELIGRTDTALREGRQTDARVQGLEKTIGELATGIQSLADQAGNIETMTDEQKKAFAENFAAIKAEATAAKAQLAESQAAVENLGLGGKLAALAYILLRHGKRTVGGPLGWIFRLAIGGIEAARRKNETA